MNVKSDMTGSVTGDCNKSTGKECRVCGKPGLMYASLVGTLRDGVCRACVREERSAFTAEDVRRYKQQGESIACLDCGEEKPPGKYWDSSIMSHWLGFRVPCADCGNRAARERRKKAREERKAVKELI